MRIAVCTLPGAPDDVRVWSGTPSHFLTGLRAVHDDVVTIGPLAPLAYRALNKFAGLTGKLGRKVNWEAEPAALRLFTKLFDREVAAVKPDVVIVMGWYPLKSQSGIPILYWGDATTGQRINQAPHWSGLSKRTEANAARIEAEALRGLTGTLWATKWAAEDAVSRYGLDEVGVVPFAANVSDPGPYTRQAPKGRVELLSVGVKWHRKGIDTAVLTADALHESGIDVHLNVVGVRPPDTSWEREYVTYHGRLNKGITAEAEKLAALYASADIFLLPTRNEPFGIVFQEAAAYGLPAVTSSVGGVPEIVEDRVTGFILGEESTPIDYAHAAKRALETSTYQALSTAARSAYEDRFTWESRARQVVSLCADHIGARA